MLWHHEQTSHFIHQIPGLKPTEKIQHGNIKNLVTDNAQKNASFYEDVSMNFNKMTFNMTDSSWRKKEISTET